MKEITTPTFIIGLGGIGNIVARLVWERYPSANERLPSTVRIRSIDTAGQSDHEFARPLPDDMFTKLGGFQANQVIQNLTLFPEIARWWKYPPNAFVPGFIDNGAGARRPVGRLVFFREFSKVHQALRGDFAGPKSDLVQRELIEAGLGNVKLTPRVIIVGSLAGGTGSGIFIDVAFLARHLFRELGYQYSGGTITGVFALPSVIHLASGDGDSNQARERQVNALAALSELDFLTRGWTESGLTIKYPLPVGEFEPQPPLLNQVYLFTDRRLKGVHFSRQSDVLQRVAHFIYGQVALGMGEETLKYIDNYKNYFDPGQQRVGDGLPAIYCSFGVEWLEVPHDRLMSAWCEHVAKPIGDKVCDIEWTQETKQNLDKVVRDRLTDTFEAYRSALHILDATPDNILTVRGMADLQIYLDAIQGAGSKSALQDALQSFDTQLTGALDGLRRLRRSLPAREEEDLWVRSIAADLVADRSFRAGGAKRTLEAAASLFGRFSEAVSPVEPVADVLRRCGGGWLSRKVDPGPALEWARRRIVEQANQIVRKDLEGRATELARLCQQQAELLVTMQQAVRSEVVDLGRRPSRGWTPPSDSWMLDQTDIDACIVANRDAVTDLATASICEALAAKIRGGDVPPQDRRVYFEGRFRDEALAAIEREAVKRTQRPGDMLQRIKNRVQTCEPLAHIVDEESELLKIMSEAQRATPLKIVLTAMDDKERAKLEQWAKEQRALAGDQNAFQIAPSNDASRDDALYLTFGWPLWLFKEAQTCYQATAVMRASNVTSVQASRVLGEMPEASQHDIRPMTTERAELLFAYAVVLGDVKPVRVDRIVFNQAEFPGAREASSLESARAHFRRDGLNRRYAKTLEKRQDDGTRV